MENSINLDIEGYSCRVDLNAYSDNAVVMTLVKEQIILRYTLMKEFLSHGFNRPTQVGIKVIGPGNKTEEVVAQKLPNGLLEIGCMQITQQELKQIYNIIKFQQHEFKRSSRK